MLREDRRRGGWPVPLDAEVVGRCLMVFVALNQHRPVSDFYCFGSDGSPSRKYEECMEVGESFGGLKSPMCYHWPAYIKGGVCLELGYRTDREVFWLAVGSHVRGALRRSTVKRDRRLLRQPCLEVRIRRCRSPSGVRCRGGWAPQSCSLTWWACLGIGCLLVTETLVWKVSESHALVVVGRSNVLRSQAWL